MPITINGIGTTYYGRKNPRVYEAYCESCKQSTRFTDYTTGHYFVVIYIPIIPLGKRQIIGECSSCRVHRVMPLKQWEQIREESLQTGFEQLATNTDDPASAIDLLYRLTTFNQIEEAFDLAESTALHHGEDFATQIAIGNWYADQGRNTLADHCFARAIAIDPQHPASCTLQATAAIKAEKLREAATFLQPLRQSDETYDPSLFYYYAVQCQKAGEHQTALDEFTELVKRNQALGFDKAFRKSVKASEKALAKAESILPSRGLFG